MSDRSRRRPWLAAVLALVVSGLGHAYLRRWARAFGWYVVITATVVLLVPDPAVDQIFAGELPPIDEVAPVLLVVAASIIDAYVIAIRNNREYERQAAAVKAPDDGAGVSSVGDAVTDPGQPRDTTASEEPPESNASVDSVTCPDCGREVDAALDFCQWCATPLEK